MAWILTPWGHLGCFSIMNAISLPISVMVSASCGPCVCVLVELIPPLLFK
jgi:hypothetical protein